MYQPPKTIRYELWAGIYGHGAMRGADTFIGHASPDEAVVRIIKGGFEWAQLVEWRHGKPFIIARWDPSAKDWDYTDKAEAVS